MLPSMAGGIGVQEEWVPGRWLLFKSILRQFRRGPNMNMRGAHFRFPAAFWGGFSFLDDHSKWYVVWLLISIYFMPWATFYSAVGKMGVMVLQSQTYCKVFPGTLTCILLVWGVYSRTVSRLDRAAQSPPDWINTSRKSLCGGPSEDCCTWQGPQDSTLQWRARIPILQWPP